MISLLALSLLACRPDPEAATPPVLEVDGVEVEADVRWEGDPSALILTVAPQGATIAGRPLDLLEYTLTGLGLDNPLDYAHWVVALVEGNLVDARFVVDGETWHLDPATVEGDLVLSDCPLVDDSDPGANVVGMADGELNIYQWNADGVSLTAGLRFTWTSLGTPDQDVEHSLHLDEIACAFGGEASGFCASAW